MLWLELCFDFLLGVALASTLVIAGFVWGLVGPWKPMLTDLGTGYLCCGDCMSVDIIWCKLLLLVEEDTLCLGVVWLLFCRLILSRFTFPLSAMGRTYDLPLCFRIIDGGGECPLSSFGGETFPLSLNN